MSLTFEISSTKSELKEKCLQTLSIVNDLKGKIVPNFSKVQMSGRKLINAAVFLSALAVFSLGASSAYGYDSPNIKPDNLKNAKPSDIRLADALSVGLGFSLILGCHFIMKKNKA